VILCFSFLGFNFKLNFQWKKMKTTTTKIFKISVTIIKENCKVGGQVHKPSIAFIKEIHKIGRELHSQALFSIICQCKHRAFPLK